MHGEMIGSLVQKALYIVLVLSCLPLLVAIVVGFGVALFQALTQIQDQSLPQVVKLVAVMLTVIFCSPWLAGQLTSYTSYLLDGFFVWTR
jgi:type III secretion protein S